MNTVIVENCKTLFIGRRGENEVTEVVFDFSEWQEQFGTGVIDLYVKRNLDVDAYPVVLSVDGTVATWLVTAADTDVVGNGKIEFVYTVNEKVAKSAVFPFFVGEDIGESSPEPPEHYQSWLEQLTELGAETQANAQAAAQSANEAAESAAQVAEDSNNAEAWAVGERNGEPVSEDDPTYNNNAKYWAENARANAPVQSVNGEDGDVVLTLDDIPNGETYVRATPEQLAQITTNAENIASVEAIADTALQPEDLTPYRTAAQQSVIDNGLNSKINGNIGSIADINAKIPFSASASNKLVDQNSFDSKLSDYRTASRQNLIDNNKQTKITANGILKGNGLGGISAAVAGMDYLPTSALAAYRSANAQDAIDNAQNQNINKNIAAINTMQPAATAADIGKALIVKTVADGKPTSYEYGEAGGGSSALTAGDGIDISNDVISNTQGIEYIVGTQTAATSKWTGVSTDETLKVGKIIAYYLPFAGTSTAATLALTMADGTTTREISLQLKPNATVTTQFPAGSMIILVYDGTYWRVNASYDTDTNTNPTGYCLTNGSVAAKAATCSFGYRGDANYFPCLFRFANTATDATLAITTYAPEAAPIYVNGARTSATNTFSAGVILFLYYNGAYYCYNDGRFPILVDGAVTSVQEYAAGMLAAYRPAADQDLIDNGKQAKITASGILKGDGAGGVSAAVAGVDYLKSAPVTSVNGQTGDVTIQTATDAQVTTAVNTWLGENVAQETGYVLDASLTMSNAAPPASAVGDLKSAISYKQDAFSWERVDGESVTGKIIQVSGTNVISELNSSNGVYRRVNVLPSEIYKVYANGNGQNSRPTLVFANGSEFVSSIATSPLEGKVITVPDGVDTMLLNGSWYPNRPAALKKTAGFVDKSTWKTEVRDAGFTITENANLVYNNGTPVSTGNPNYIYTEIPVKNGQTFIVTATGNKQTISFYDNNHFICAMILTGGKSAQNLEVTAPADAYYMVVNSYVSYGITIKEKMLIPTVPKIDGVVYDYLHHDNFNRANSATSLGSNGDNNKDMSYTMLPNTAVCGIVDNEAYYVSSPSQCCAVRDVGTADVIIDCQTDLSQEDAATSNTGIAFRVSDAQNLWCAYRRLNFFGVDKFVNGTRTNVIYIYAPTGGQYVEKISVICKDNKITLLLDGMPFGEVEDSFNSAETKHGLFWGRFSKGRVKYLDIRKSRNPELSVDSLDSGNIPFYWTVENGGYDYAMTFVKETRGSKNANRFQLVKADGYKRSEIHLPRFSKQMGEQIISFDMLLGEDYSVYDPQGEIISQFHDSPENGDSTSENAKLQPDVALYIVNGRYIVHQQWDEKKNATPADIAHKLSADIGPIVDDIGKWVNWAWHIKWSYAKFFEPITELWKNGELVYSSDEPNTVNATNPCYFKVGVYQWNYADNPSVCNSTSRTMVVDNILVES